MTADSPPASEAHRAAGSGLSESASFGAGIAAIGEGLRFLVRHGSLWRYVAPFAFCRWLSTAIVLAAMLFAGIGFVRAVHGAFVGATTGWSYAFWLLLEAAAAIVVVLAVGWVAGLLVRLTLGLVEGWLDERLAAATERRLGASPGELPSLPLAVSWREGMYDGLVVAGLNLLLLALNFVPILGGGAAAAFGWYAHAWLAGRTKLALPLVLRGAAFRERSAFIARHAGAVFGLGFPLVLLDWLPLIGAISQSAATIGAVLLCRRLRTTESPRLGSLPSLSVGPNGHAASRTSS